MSEIYGISVKINNRFEPLDVGRGVTVGNIIHSTIYWNKKDAEKQLEQLKKDVPKHEFKLVNRG